MNPCLSLSVIWPDVSVMAMPTIVIPVGLPTAACVRLKATQREIMWVLRDNKTFWKGFPKQLLFIFRHVYFNLYILYF